MTRIEYRPFKPGDAASIDSWRLPPDSRASLDGNLAVVMDTTFTFVADGQVVGVGGLVLGRRGSAEAWNVFSDWALARYVGIPFAVRRLLDDRQASMRLYRVWATGNVDEWDRLSRWFRFLGFEYEGRMQKWGPDGQDQHFFVRLREWA